MELWIRSQDREILTQVDNVCLDAFVNYNGIDIITKIKSSDKSGKLGTYKTKERALEVLDEIQKYITPTLSLLDDTLKGKQVCQVGNILSMVYEMPKE